MTPREQAAQRMAEMLDRAIERAHAGQVVAVVFVTVPAAEYLERVEYDALEANKGMALAFERREEEPDSHGVHVSGAEEGLD